MAYLQIIAWTESLPPGCFGLWVFVGDEGGDVVGGIRLIKQEIELHENKAILSVPCFMHGLQNCCKKAVTQLDKFGPKPQYSTQIQRIANVWRSFGHHRKIHKTIKELYGDDAAVAHASTSIGNVVKDTIC